MVLPRDLAVQRYLLRSRPNLAHNILTPRSTNPNHSLCVDLDSGKKIVISRTTLIVAFTICVIITCVSVFALAAFLYRDWTRRRKMQAATRWSGCKRISVVRKEIDDQYSRQFSGCLYQEPKNPYMYGGSPVEIMQPERLCEVPAISSPSIARGNERSRRLSTLFDQGVGLWMAKK